MRKAVTPYVTTNKQHPATAVSTESEAHGQKSARPPMVHQAGTCRRSTGPVRSSIATRPNPLPMKIVCCQLSKARRRHRVPERVSNFVLTKTEHCGRHVRQRLEYVKHTNRTIPIGRDVDNHRECNCARQQQYRQEIHVSGTNGTGRCFHSTYLSIASSRGQELTVRAGTNVGMADVEPFHMPMRRKLGAVVV